MASDSENDLLIFMMNDEEEDENVQNAEGKRKLKEYGRYRKEGRNTFVQDCNDSVGCWLSDYEFKMKYQCSCRSLYAITKMIKDHKIFKNGK